MSFWERWYRHIEVGLIVLALLGLGAYYFSRITSAQQREIEVEAGLEQLYRMEQAHFERYRYYFNPLDRGEGLEWKWMEAYNWEVRIGSQSFWLAVRADLDGDGEVGLWAVDERSPRVQRLVAD